MESDMRMARFDMSASHFARFSTGLFRHFFHKPNGNEGAK
jgi:hypothetical protein